MGPLLHLETQRNRTHTTTSLDVVNNIIPWHPSNQPRTKEAKKQRNLTHQNREVQDAPARAAERERERSFYQKIQVIAAITMRFMLTIEKNEPRELITIQN